MARCRQHDLLVSMSHVCCWPLYDDKARSAVFRGHDGGLRNGCDVISLEHARSTFRERLTRDLTDSILRLCIAAISRGGQSSISCSHSVSAAAAPILSTSQPY